jgi:hypothetical protein
MAKLQGTMSWNKYYMTTVVLMRHSYLGHFLKSVLLEQTAQQCIENASELFQVTRVVDVQVYELLLYSLTISSHSLRSPAD